MGGAISRAWLPVDEDVKREGSVTDARRRRGRRWPEDRDAARGCIFLRFKVGLGLFNMCFAVISTMEIAKRPGVAKTSTKDK